MTSLYPVQEASEEGLHSADEQAVQHRSQSPNSYPEYSKNYNQQGSLVDGALTPVNSPAYTKGPSQSGSWRSESKSNYTLAGPSGSTMQEMDSLLAAEKVLEAELVGIDSDLLHKLPPEVARQLSQKAIVTAAAQTAGNGVAAPMDLLRRTTSKNSGREFASESQQYTPYEHPGALGRNLSVNTNSSRRVSKTPSSLAGPNDGWRFTNDEVATHPQNTWQYPSESGAAFKGLNYGSNSPPQPQMDPAGLKYATKQVQQEYRHMQEAGEEEEPPQWNVHQHVAPVTDSQAAEMYHKSMDWRQRNKLRYAELKREIAAEELAQCTFSPKINQSSKRLAQSARRPKTARGSPSVTPSPPKQSLQSANKGAKKQLDFHNGKRPSTAPYGAQQQQQVQAADTVSEGAASAMSCATAAGRELYERGMEMKQRQEQIREQLRKAEVAEYKAQSPHAARLSPQIYGLGVQQRVESMRANAMTLSHSQKRLLHDPSLAECTFRPTTNFTLRRKPRPASAVREQAPGAAFDLSEYADLLASPDSQQGSPGDASQPQDQEGSLATLTQLASPASSCPNSRGKGRGPAQLADGESSSWEAKEQRSSKFSGISADLDFEEFLLRQRRFLEDKKSKVEHELDAHQQKMRAGGLALSQGTRRILHERERNARKAGQAAAAMTGVHAQGTEDLSGSNLIERLENELVAQTAALDDMLNPGSSNSTKKAAKQAELSLPESQLMTYKPAISRRAHELPARSFEELSEGDRLRHACYVEHMRLEALKKEEAELTFKPKINKYHDVRAQLNLRHPEAYLAQVHAKRQAQLAQRLEERRLMEEKELEECTFSPKITTMPSYIPRSEHGLYSSMTSRSNTKYAERAAQRTVEWV